MVTQRVGYRILLVLLSLAVVPACSGEAPEGPLEPVGETPEQGGWKAVTVTGGLMHPWSAVWLPDGKTMLVTEREGRLRVVEDGKLRMEPVAGLPEILAIGQGGLMDLALHPDFQKNRWIYFTYTSGKRNANRTTLARARIDEKLARLQDVKVLFRVDKAKPGGQHFGSRLLWMSDGTLLMSIGDGGNPPIKLDGRLIRLNAQDLSTHLGKTVRMQADGSPASDNPFADDDDPETDPYIWTYGHRNIQGMARHPKTGKIWATEHGARGGDELNILQKGENYGWPKATYSREYFGPRISDKTTLKGAVHPEVVWTPCIAPSGLTFYTGKAFADWQGDLLAGGLVLRQIRRIRFADGKIAGQTTLQFEDRIRWVEMGPDGGLYVLTDEIDGRLLRIVPAEDD
jgi:glucose/arabinose dehydrogenase